MPAKTLIALILTALLTAAGPLLQAAPGLAQKPSGASPGQEEPLRLTITGKITYQEKMASYMVTGVEPPYAHYFITNPNKAVLDRLVQTNATVTLEGILPQGAEFIRIDKLDGKPYTPDQ